MKVRVIYQSKKKEVNHYALISQTWTLNNRSVCRWFGRICRKADDSFRIFRLLIHLNTKRWANNCSNNVMIPKNVLFFDWIVSRTIWSWNNCNSFATFFSTHLQSKSLHNFVHWKLWISSANSYNFCKSKFI